MAIVRTALRNDEISIPSADSAASAVPKVPWLVLCVAVGDDNGEARAALFRRLRSIALQSMRQRPWPAIERQQCACGRMPAADYSNDLIHLALIELSKPERRNVRDRAAWFGVSERRWSGAAARPYAVVNQPLQGWHRDAVLRLRRVIGRP